MAKKSRLTIWQTQLVEALETREEDRPMAVKIQRVAHYLRNRESFVKYYSPKVLSIGPIHCLDKNLKLGEQYKLQWTARYVKRCQQTGQTQHESAQTPPHMSQPPPKKKRILIPQKKKKTNSSRKCTKSPTLPANAKTLYSRIKKKIKELKDHFTEDAIKGFTDDELSWILFVDGCSLLQILEKAPEHPEELDVTDDQLDLVVQDVLLLENQLPFQVLKLLSSSQDNKASEDNEASEDIEASEDKQAEAEANLVNIMDKFLQKRHHLSPETEEGGEQREGMGQTEEGNLPKEATIVDVQKPVRVPVPTHLLDRLRTNVLGPKDKGDEKKEADTGSGKDNKAGCCCRSLPINCRLFNQKGAMENNHHQEQPGCSELKNGLRNKFRCLNPKGNKKNKMRTHRNIQELKAAGIKMKTSKSRGLRDISFCSCGLFGARLKLPEIIVDDATVPTLMNLIAYEMCPDFENEYEICSFVAFMDSLIDHPDDVKELRSAGVLYSALGSDEDVAKLFNIIADSVLDMDTYEKTRKDIEKHYTKKWNTFMSEAYNTYFNNPWSFLGFLAAFLLLFLTCVQTWYAIPL